jgi:hypothetical protein
MWYGIPGAICIVHADVGGICTILCLIAVWVMCEQFRQNGCENCPFLEMDKERDNVVNCTTPNFTG